MFTLCETRRCNATVLLDRRRPREGHAVVHPCEQSLMPQCWRRCASPQGDPAYSLLS